MKENENSIYQKNGRPLGDAKRVQREWWRLLSLRKAPRKEGGYINGIYYNN